MSCLNCKNRELCRRENLVCMNIKVCFRCDKKNSCKTLCKDMKEYLSLFDNNKGYSETKTWLYENIEDFKEVEEHSYFKRYNFNIKNVPFDLLSSRDRELVIAHIMEDISYNKIANMYSCDNSEIQRIVLRSLQKLKDYYYLRESLKNNKNKLTRMQYKYLNLYYMYGKSIKEIVDIEKKTKRSILEAINRGRKKLEDLKSGIN